jgi:hypothetical protein
MRNVSRFGFFAMSFVAAFFLAGNARAGFTGTDLFVPGVARTGGVGGSQFYTTLWITNVSSAPASIHIGLLVLGTANPSPVTKSDVIRPMPRIATTTSSVRSSVSPAPAARCTSPPIRSCWFRRSSTTRTARSPPARIGSSKHPSKASTASAPPSRSIHRTVIRTLLLHTSV